MKIKFNKIYIAMFLIFVLALSNANIVAKNASTIDIIPETPEPKSQIEIKAIIAE